MRVRALSRRRRDPFSKVLERHVLRDHRRDGRERRLQLVGRVGHVNERALVARRAQVDNGRARVGVEAASARAGAIATLGWGNNGRAQNQGG